MVIFEFQTKLCGFQTLFFKIQRLFFEVRTLFLYNQTKIFEIQRLIFWILTVIFEIKKRIKFKFQSLFFFLILQTLISKNNHKIWHLKKNARKIKEYSLNFKRHVLLLSFIRKD